MDLGLSQGVLKIKGPWADGQLTPGHAPSPGWQQGQVSLGLCLWSIRSGGFSLFRKKRRSLT